MTLSNIYILNSSKLLILKSNEITLISKEIQTPNGIGLTPNETYLYVN